MVWLMHRRTRRRTTARRSMRLMHRWRRRTVSMAVTMALPGWVLIVRRGQITRRRWELLVQRSTTCTGRRFRHVLIRTFGCLHAIICAVSIVRIVIEERWRRESLIGQAQWRLNIGRRSAERSGTAWWHA